MSPTAPPAPVPSYYVPGTLPMPPFPPGYVPPLVVPHDPTIRPEGDVERLRGGDFFCETYQERDEIPAIYRREGITMAYVRTASGSYAGDTFWYLRGGITNEYWTPREDAGRGELQARLPPVIRGGNANPENFAPEGRYLLY